MVTTERLHDSIPCVSPIERVLPLDPAYIEEDDVTARLGRDAGEPPQQCLHEIKGADEKCAESQGKA